MEEKWEDIKDFEGLYKVSNLGRVKSLTRYVNGRYGERIVKERILSPSKSQNGEGYYFVGLHKDGKVFQKQIHRLVASSFIINSNNLPEVNHKDENKFNNCVNNLEWCTSEYNSNYGTHIERVREGNLNGKNSKKVFQFDLNGALIKEWISINEIERQTGFKSQSINYCCLKKILQSYNYIWRYEDNFNWSLNPVLNTIIKLKTKYIINHKKLNFYKNHDILKELLIDAGENKYNELFKNINYKQQEDFLILHYKGYQFWDMPEKIEEYWEKDDDDFLKECRGIVINLKKNEIVLLPQKKFFNLNENCLCSYDKISEKIKKSSKVEISNKIDGSNLNYRWYNNTIFMASSNSLNKEQSVQLKDGYEMLNKEDNYIQLAKDYSDWTICVEYISQKDAHVVLYSKEQEGLYLFGMRNVYTGQEKSYEEVIEIGKAYNVKTTEVFDDTLDGIMSKVDDYTSDEKEGWVINIIDENKKNFKVKLKVNDYVYMHKILSKLTSPNLVVEAIADDKFDDFISKVPVAHREKVNKYSQIVYDYLKHMEGIVQGYYFMAPKDDKKEFMIWIDKVVLKKYQGYVRSLYLKKQYNFLKKGTLATPSYKKFNEILKEEGISVEEISEDDG